MKFQEIEKLIASYFTRPFIKRLLEYGVIFDMELVFDTIIFLLESNYENEILFNKEVDFNNLSILEYSYTKAFPADFIEGGEESLTIYFVIQDFYSYLLEENVITPETYSQALVLLASKREIFIEEMNTPKAWSKEKKEFFSEFEQDFDDFLGKPFVKNVESNGKEKVITVDFGGKTSAPKKKQGGYQLRVDILGAKPPVWRRITIPEGLTFSKLSEIVYRLFQWQKSQDYYFAVGRNRMWNPIEASKLYLNILQKDASDTNIDKYLLDFKTFKYYYEENDERVLNIKLENVLTQEELKTFPQVPMCLKGKGEVTEEGSTGFDIDAINQRLNTLPKINGYR